MAQTVKNLPTTRETWVRSLGWDDPLEEDMATHSSILAWRIPWTEEAGGLQSMGLQRVRHDFHLGRGIEGLVMLFCMRVCAVRVRDGGQEKDGLRLLSGGGALG